MGMAAKISLSHVLFSPAFTRNSTLGGMGLAQGLFGAIILFWSIHLKATRHRNGFIELQNGCVWLDVTSPVDTPKIQFTLRLIGKSILCIQPKYFPNSPFQPNIHFQIYIFRISIFIFSFPEVCSFRIPHVSWSNKYYILYSLTKFRNR